MQPPADPCPAESSYLRILARAASALVGLGSTGIIPRRAVARTARERATLRALDAALLTSLGVALWIAFSGGGELKVGERIVSFHGLRNPLRVAFLLALLRAIRADAAGGPWRLPRALAGLARLAPWLRFRVLVAALAVLGTWLSLLRIGELVPEVRADLRGNRPEIRADGWNMHLVPLVRWMTEESSRPEVAVLVEDINARGHLASFYCYPRLLRMNPTQHRWALQDRIAQGRCDDPGYRPTLAKPSLEDCIAWARSRALACVIARPAGVEVVTP